ncbi:aminoglycoside phosphotransferase family protein [Nonomuraea soli]|uniref:Aminoglycoside phosphotransferase (APT) family kinase protein n=1 Tax=Nonomuraea soli TaxID=1032476 RepID=A0A7W0CGG2_9ACTN|nr:aminoglycoside phosphotransferase family protein [Nonomuraea soli]MBA2890721.1 aminoglycoside phosphotransferase (APT) family kinase protein [Nonomuraea soli]
MKDTEIPRAVAAAVGTAAMYGLGGDDATVLHNSNRIAVRLRPSGVLARVAPLAQRPDFEVEVARRLAGTGSPVAGLDPRAEPRVHVRDGFAVTLWTYHEPTAAPEDHPPAAYAGALARLHAGLRGVDLAAPSFTDRVADALRVVEDPAVSPALGAGERALLTGTLYGISRAILERRPRQQLLHGEPHPGNLLATADGPLFTDLETVCRGPVEFDLAHAPEGVAAHYPGADAGLLADCRILSLALVVSWRWDRDDQLPDGRRRGREWLAQLQDALHRRERGAGG